MEMCGSTFWWILKSLAFEFEWTDSAPKCYLWVNNTHVTYHELWIWFLAGLDIYESISIFDSKYDGIFSDGIFGELENTIYMSTACMSQWASLSWDTLSMCQQVSLYSSPYVSQDSIQTNRSKALSIGYRLQAVNVISRLWRCDLVVLDIWVNEHLRFEIRWDFFRSLFWRAWKRYLYICRQVSNLHTWVDEHLWDFNAIYVSTGLYASPCHESGYDEIFQTGFSESLKMLSTYQQVSRHARATEGLSVRLGLGLRRVHQTRTDTIFRYISKSVSK